MARPNLLFIYTDEQAFNTLAAYGNRQIHMPNLNRLAAEGTVFDRAYVTQPVCTPSRSSLLTGLYPHTNGCTQNNVPLAPDALCLPEMLGDSDYVTGHYGKWHLGDEIFAQHGFEHWVSIEDGYRKHYSPDCDPAAKSDYWHFLQDAGVSPEDGEFYSRRQAARLPEELGKPAFLGRRSAEFIREHKHDPFVLYVNFLEPHMPFFGPRDSQYPPDTVALPANFNHEPGADQPLKVRLRHEQYKRQGHGGVPLQTEDDWRGMIARYWGLCSLIDTHVGTVLDALDECGLRDDTIVAFTADHGDMMGAHRLLEKSVMYEEAVRVPLVIRLPGQREGRRVSGPVSQIDIVPTLLDFLGVSPPEHLQGKSLRPLLESPVAESRNDAVIEWNVPNGLGNFRGRVDIPEWTRSIADPEAVTAANSDPVRTVVTPQGWKFNCSPLGEHELYDLRNDPGETENVFTNNRSVAAALRENLRRWQEATGDEVELPEV